MALLEQLETAKDADEGDSLPPPNVTDEAPAVEEAPASITEPVISATGETPTPQTPMAIIAGLTQDAEGRWRRPNGTFADKAEIEAQTTGAPAIPAVVSTPVEPTRPSEPYTYRANRQTHPLTGAVRNADGTVTITPDGLVGLQTLLADAHSFRSTYPQERTQWQQRLKQAESAGIEKGSRADALMAEVDKVFATPESVVEFYQNFETNKAALEARAEARVYKQQLEDMRRGNGAAPQQASGESDVTEDALRADLSGSLEDVFESEEFKAVFQPADRERISGRLGDMVTRGLYFQAERDFTEEECRTAGFDTPGGIMKGAIVLNEQALLEEVRWSASLIKGYRAEAQKQAKDALEAKEFNAKRGVPTGTATRVATTPPPSVSATTPAPSDDEYVPKKRTYDEWAKEMGIYR